MTHSQLLKGAQMWAQVEKQRNKEELEHAP
jgi:hypothetical protein